MVVVEVTLVLLFWVIFNNGILICFGITKSGVIITFPVAYNEHYSACCTYMGSRDYTCIPVTAEQYLTNITFYIKTLQGQVDWAGSMHYIILGY